MVFLLSSLALGGYGDAIDGRPSHVEREVHFWTNMVRIDPSAFQGDYPCSFNSFASSEKTPKQPLQWNHDLGEAARVHSDDMNARDYFDHDTLGGPTFSQRVWSYYSGGAIGENIALGYGSAWDAVIEGWMCSSGHRSNIMSSSFDELGTGVSGPYYTQDFGGGNPPRRALAMGIHLPEDPGAEVDYAVDWIMTEAPSAVYVVVNGERHDLDRFIGDAGGWSGWSARLPVSGGCTEYYFVGEAAGLMHTFPEEGSYTFGSCANDDAEAGWVARQLDWDEEEPPDAGTDTGDGTDSAGPTGDAGEDEGTGTAEDDTWADTEPEEDVPPPAASGGCSTAGSAGSLLGLLVGMVGARRRGR